MFPRDNSTRGLRQVGQGSSVVRLARSRSLACAVISRPELHEMNDAVLERVFANLADASSKRRLIGIARYNCSACDVDSRRFENSLDQALPETLLASNCLTTNLLHA